MQKLYYHIYPMRVTLITCAHRNKDNVMTATWCFPLSAQPPLFGVAVSPKRFSCELIEKSKQFVINIPGEELKEEVKLCGTLRGRNEDKFGRIKLTMETSKKVAAPSIKECLVSIECNVIDRFTIGDHVLFVGEAVHVEERKQGKGIYQKDGELISF